MSKRVTIPVEVTGDEAAKQQLADVGQAATAASTEHAQAQTKTADATTEAARATGQFDASARGAVGTLLSRVNPTLGALFSIVTRLGTALRTASTQLLALAGVGAALAVVVTIFQRITDAARRAEEAIRRAHEAQRARAQEGISLRGRLAERAERAGIIGAVSEMAELVEALRARGIPEDLATFGALAAQRGARPEELDQLMGAWIARGRPEWERRPGAAERLIEQLRRVPAAEAQAALAAKLRDIRETLPPTEPVATAEERAIERAIRELQAAHPEIGPDAWERLRADIAQYGLTGRPVPVPVPREGPGMTSALLGGRVWPHEGKRERLRRELQTIVEELVAEQRHSAAMPSMNIQVYSVGTGYFGPPRQSYVQSWEQAQ